jgi:hypothetical protein
VLNLPTKQIVKRISCRGYKSSPIGSSLRDVECQVRAFESWSNFTRILDLMGQTEGDFEGQESARASAKRGMVTPGEQEDLE